MSPQLMSQPTFTDGQLMHMGQLNVLPYNIDQLSQMHLGHPASASPSTKPLCKVTLTSSLAISSGTNAVIGWDTAVVNTDNMWSGVDPYPISINTSGWYRIVSSVWWASGSASERGIQILVNGDSDPANVVAISNILLGQTGQCRQQTVAIERLAAGAVIYTGILQRTGSNLNAQVQSSTSWGTSMTAAYIGAY